MILLIFIDGIGLGHLGASNPFARAPIEALAPLGGGASPNGLSCNYIDASLGHPGLPQSATGQAVLFTGEDAIAEAGGHWAGAPTPRIIRFVTERSLFARAQEEGLKTALLNAYEPRRKRHIERVLAREERPMRLHPLSTTTWATLAGGAAVRSLDDVLEGRAATFDLTGDVLRAFGVSAPKVTVRDAARALVRGAREVDLAAFEIFLTDTAGHAQDITWARHEIRRTDELLVRLFEEIDPSRDLVVMTSDHGNLEDLSTRSHTRNPIPFYAYGHGADAITEGARTLRDVGPRLLSRARREARARTLA